MEARGPASNISKGSQNYYRASASASPTLMVEVLPFRSISKRGSQGRSS